MLDESMNMNDLSSDEIRTNFGPGRMVKRLDLPSTLPNLHKLALTWGITDEAARHELLHRASKTELKQLVDTLHQNFSALEHWLEQQESEEKDDQPVYAVFVSLMLAGQQANRILMDQLSD